MSKVRTTVNKRSKLMLFSLITILFVTIRILIDISSFIPAINNGWGNITWTVTAIMMLLFNVIAIVFTYLEWHIAKNKHRVLLSIVFIILFFTLMTEFVWAVIDVISLTGKDTWHMINLIGELKVLTVIGIACEFVAIPVDVLSTYFISKQIKES